MLKHILEAVIQSANFKDILKNIMYIADTLIGDTAARPHSLQVDKLNL